MDNLDVSFLEKISDKSIFSKPACPQEIEQAEKELNCLFPEEIKNFFSKYGAVRTRSEFNLYGLGTPRSASPSLVWARNWLSFLAPDFPDDLIPVGTIDWNVYACLELKSPGRVLRWIGSRLTENQSREVIANSYAEFLLKVSKEIYLLDQALITLEKRVIECDEKYHYDLEGKGKLPRNQDYRVHRFCSRDIILGVMALKLQKGINCMVVDLFLPINIPPFEREGSLIFMTLFLLGDAYRCGGTMEIRFTENVDGGQVPRKLQALAKSIGAEIKTESLQNRKLDPDDATRLYLALTGFSDQVRVYMEQNQISPLKACFVVHRGIWNKAEVEMLLITSPDPNRIFNGGADPGEWCNYQEDLLFSRSAVLGGILSRAFSRRHVGAKEDGQIDIEDDTNEVNIGILPMQHALAYQVFPPKTLNNEDIAIPWLVNGTSSHQEVQPGQKFIVLVRARKWAEFKIEFGHDLKVASTIQKEHNCPVFILVPRDFLDLHIDELRSQWIINAGQENIGIIACGEDVVSLEEETVRRWRASKLVRD